MTDRPTPSTFDRSTANRPTRRTVLAASAGVAGLLAGCFEEEPEPEPADPISLEGAVCDVCGMVIDEHPGPAGQLFYVGGDPADDEGPATFDSIASCLRTYHDERSRRGGTIHAAFVTDYSAVDYEVTEVDGTDYISTHVSVDVFADASDLFYVVGSDVEGAMGEEFVPFSDRDDAEAFADDHGGDIRSWDDVLG